MRSEITTTLGRRAGSDATAPEIADHMRAQARLAAQAMGDSPAAPRHTEALGTAAELIVSQPRTDPRIYIMNVLSAHSGNDRYTPGENQSQLFARLGTDGPPPLPEITLNELVAAAVDDHLQRTADKVHEAQLERDEALRDLEVSEAAREQAESEAARLSQLTDERDAAVASSAELTEQITHLRAMLQTEAAGEARPSKRSRRKVLDGHKGIYYRPTPDGDLPPESERVYEIGWIEDGKQAWKAIGPDLKEAVAERARLTEPMKEAA